MVPGWLLDIDASGKAVGFKRDTTVGKKDTTVVLSLEQCQLNGVFSNIRGKCICDSGWGGASCGTLQLQPVDPLKQGLRARGVSSWGGSVAWDEMHNEYVMFVSVFTAGCGLNSWTRNSAIARASSATAEGPYTLQEIVKPHFAHSPQVVRNAKTGKWLLYHIGAGSNRSAEEVQGLHSWVHSTAYQVE